jgi:hypothetical protein
MILHNEEHDRQDMRSDLERKIAARILKDNLAGRVMPPKRQIYPFMCEEASESHTAAGHGQIVAGSEYPFDLYWRCAHSLFSQQKLLFKSGEEVRESLRVITVINIFEVRKIAAGVFDLAFDLIVVSGSFIGISNPKFRPN